MRGVSDDGVPYATFDPRIDRRPRIKSRGRQMRGPPPKLLQSLPVKAASCQGPDASTQETTAGSRRSTSPCGKETKRRRYASKPVRRRRVPLTTSVDGSQTTKLSSPIASRISAKGRPRTPTFYSSRRAEACSSMERAALSSSICARHRPSSAWVRPSRRRAIRRRSTKVSPAAGYRTPGTG